MENILVTGCCGFIGHRISEILLQRGLSVVGMDNMNDSYDPRLKDWRLQKLRQYEGFSFHKADIGEFHEVRTVFSNYRVDAVIHLAARVGVRPSVDDPWTYLDTNMKGTLNLLECCKTKGIRKFILASTSGVYGDAGKRPFSVKESTDHPLAPYAATKKGAEALCYSYHYLCGMDITVFRYFTVYGPAGRPDMSYFRFIRNIDRGKPIPVFGDGSQERDFTYIDDIAEGTIRGLDHRGFGIFNLGNDRPVGLRRLISLIENNLEKKAEIAWLPMHPADMKATWADIAETKEVLQWRPMTLLEEGIKKTINWHQENRDLVVSLEDR
ncbi:MAG: NAD-dependent epimerase/dehydratase family protein [Nitrospirales bacterium]|nr:NAD-dependent epimerase/dehydratase family protein [Nitrospirales bacterium]